MMAERLGIRAVTVDIAPVLEALGCYRIRDDAIRQVVPGYGSGWKSKIVLPPLTDRARLNVFQLVAQPPSGEPVRVRLPHDVYLQVVAASNMKQRTRKLIEYHHAERLHYAVAGTPNRLEYDQGFFVKGGDGLADLKPIAHLYKTQVYALAEVLGVPEEIRSRTPTTDTYSMPQTQEEFYFALPYDKMDLCLWGMNHGIEAEEVAAEIGVPADLVRMVYRDIEAKRRTTRFLHEPPVLVEAVAEIEPAGDRP
jgi:NAD+ synthase